MSIWPHNINGGYLYLPRGYIPVWYKKFSVQFWWTLENIWHYKILNTTFYDTDAFVKKTSKEHCINDYHINKYIQC